MPNRPQHYSADKAAEWPDEKPIGAKLSPATAVAADDPRLSGQRRPIVNALDVEIPDSARETGGPRCVKIGPVEGREITRRPPQFSADAPNNFFFRPLPDHAASRLDPRL